MIKLLIISIIQKYFSFFLFIKYCNYVLRNGEQDYDNVPNYEELESNDNKNNVKGKRNKFLIFLIKYVFIKLLYNY